MSLLLSFQHQGHCPLSSSLSFGCTCTMPSIEPVGGSLSTRANRSGSTKEQCAEQRTEGDSQSGCEQRGASPVARGDFSKHPCSLPHHPAESTWSGVTGEGAGEGGAWCHPGSLATAVAQSQERAVGIQCGDSDQVQQRSLSGRPGAGPHAQPVPLTPGASPGWPPVARRRLSIPSGHVQPRGLSGFLCFRTSVSLLAPRWRQCFLGIRLTLPWRPGQLSRGNGCWARKENGTCKGTKAGEDLGHTGWFSD